MNIKEILEENRIEFRESGEHDHVTEGFIGVDCPLCTPNANHFRLGFALYGSGCSCWSCGKQSAGEMLGLLLGKPTKVAWAILLKGREWDGALVKKARGKLKLPSGSRPLASPHKKYLKGRRFCPDELEELYGLLGTCQDSNRPWSIVFPVKQEWEALSFFTRKLHDRGTRYLSAEAKDETVSAKELLFAEDFCVNAICVCEGAMDAIRIGPGAVATMGLTVSSSQVRRLCRYQRVVTCFDNEPNAQRRAQILCDRVGAFGIEVINVCVSGKDAADSPEKDIKEIRRLLR